MEGDGAAKRDYRLLLSVPRIGKAVATALVTLFQQCPGANRRQIVALVDLDPRKHRLRSFVHNKVRINKRGDGFVRKVLFEATLAAVRFNPAVRKTYRRLKENGKPEKVARIAAARKLLLIAHAMYRSGQPYRDPKASGDWHAIQHLTPNV